MALSYGRAGRLNTKNAGFRPEQWLYMQPLDRSGTRLLGAQKGAALTQGGPPDPLAERFCRTPAHLC